MGILRFNYRRTNCYLVPGNGGALIAFDAGWPCTYFEYARALKETGRRIEEVQGVIVSHFHLDHAGLVGEMLRRGIDCLAFENQVGHVDRMERMILRQHKDYVRIDKSRLRVMPLAEAESWLSGLGIGGDIVETPGHSPDGISFVSSEGEALVGDLPPEALIMENDAAGRISWERLRSRKAHMIYPAHGLVYSIAG